MDWAANFTVWGVGDWRLPDTHLMCSAGSAEICAGSELGNMVYNVLGSTVNIDFHIPHNSNYGLFTKISSENPDFSSNTYWTSTPDTRNINMDDVWLFYTDGNHDAMSAGVSISAWAVHDGDVTSMPIPSAIWLFGSD